MSITNSQSGTNVHEIAPSIYRISTPVPPTLIPGGFTFNQILVVDDESLLFHTGPRRMFPLVSEAVKHVLGDVAKLRWVAFSHVESDECGALNDWLAASPSAEPVCSTTAAMVSMNDLADRPPHPLADGQELPIGKKTMRWLDAPHMPHNWECGYMFESTTRTLLCGDILTHGGSDVPPTTEGDILGPAKAMVDAMPTSVALDRSARSVIEKLAATDPTTLALMHGSSFRGDGRALLLAFADSLGI